MKMKTILHIADWYAGLSDEKKEIAATASSLELRLLSDCKLSEREKGQAIKNFIIVNKISNKKMATWIAAWAIKNNLEDTPIPEIAFIFVKNHIDLWKR